MDVICVLPARLSSTRISKKPLQEIAGRSLLEWCWRAASSIPVFDRVVVATDSEEIEGRARAFEAETVRTSPDHATGTDRVDEAADILGAADDDVVVNFQADEPFVDPGTVGGAVRAVSGEWAGHAPLAAAALEDLATAGPDISTLAAPIRSEVEWQSPGVVKVARAADGRALYFSRSPIPFSREDAAIPGASPPTSSASSPWLRHIGIYACRRRELRRWASLPQSPLERIERLEQLRALEAGMRIHVEVGPWTEPGIDLPADIERAKAVLSRA